MCSPLIYLHEVSRRVCMVWNTFANPLKNFHSNTRKIFALKHRCKKYFFMYFLG